MRERKPSLAAIRRANAMFAPVGQLPRMSQKRDHAEIGTPAKAELEVDPNKKGQTVSPTA